MAMNPGADLSSLPTGILDNPDNLVVHAYAACILELSYVAINNLSQLYSFRSHSTRSFSKPRLFISRMPNFLLHYLLGITDCKSSWCWNVVYSHHRRNLRLLSVIFCLFQLGSWQELILELSYVAINNLSQLYSFRSYSTRLFSKPRLFISRMPNFLLHYLLGITDCKSSWCWNVVYSHLLTSTQSASPLSHLLSISVGLSTAARWPTISSSTVLRFFIGTQLFSRWWHGCVGADGVGWLLMCVRVGLLARPRMEISHSDRPRTSNCPLFSIAR